MALLASSLQPLSFGIGGQAAVTLSAAQASAQAIQLTGALTGPCTVTLPNALFIGAVLNGTTGGQNVILTAGIGSTLIVLPSNSWLFYQCDGATNVIALSIGYGALNATSFSINGTPLQAILRGYIGGLITANDITNPTTVLNVSAGSCTDSTHTVSITLGNITKSTSGAWVAGSGQPGMGAGLAIAPTTWYFVFAIINAGVSDMYFDTDPGGLHIPGGTTAFRRIGAISTDPFSQILAFVQDGDEFSWIVPLASVNISTLGGADTLFALPTPFGIRTKARFNAVMFNGTARGSVLFRDPDVQSNPVFNPPGNASLTNAQGIAAAGQFEVWTNLVQEISAVAENQNTTLGITTTGWTDRRNADV